MSLPDGRTQIVSYKVSDENSGFEADVRYEGIPNPQSQSENYQNREPKTLNDEPNVSSDIQASNPLPINSTPNEDNREETVDKSETQDK